MFFTQSLSCPDQAVEPFSHSCEPILSAGLYLHEYMSMKVARLAHRFLTDL